MVKDISISCPIGQDEIQRNVYKIRNTISREDTEIPFEEFISYIKTRT